MENVATTPASPEIQPLNLSDFRKNDTYKYRFLDPQKSGGAQVKADIENPLKLPLLIIGGIITVYGIGEMGMPEGLFPAFIVYVIYHLSERLMAHLAYEEQLRWYSKCVLPLIAERQQSPNDTHVAIRAEEHIRLLKESGNQLYANGKIEVLKFYHRDSANFCESWDEYKIRVEDEIRDYLNRKVIRVHLNDEKWKEEHYYGQRVFG